MNKHRPQVFKLDPEVKKRWLEALRSGKYSQGKGALRSPEGFCCLGVLCDALDPSQWDGCDYDSEMLVLPAAVVEEVFGSFDDRMVDPYVKLGDEQKTRLLAMFTSKSAQSGDSYRDIELGYARLATLNDHGFTFAEIADIIEEQL